MNFQSGNLYHIHNQGNNQQIIFQSHEDYIVFTMLLRKYLLPQTEIIAWCLMPNHFHIMVYTDDRCLPMLKQGGIYIDPVTNGIRKILSGYARIFNNRYSRTGSLFRQKTKVKCLTDITTNDDKNIKMKAEEYSATCFHYIHQNPLRAGVVNRMEKWEYSSFKDYAGLRRGTLCNRELAANLCLYNSQTFIEASYNQFSSYQSDRGGQTS